jgi:hypothetical protein
VTNRDSKELSDHLIGNEGYQTGMWGLRERRLSAAKLGRVSLAKRLEKL